MDYKKYDTYAETVYLIRLSMDAKVFKRTVERDGKSFEAEDVVLTFCDNNRVPGLEDLWVDARVATPLNDRAKKYRKGDEMQIRGKLRFKRQDDGTWRGKIYDAWVSSFVNTKERHVESSLVLPSSPESDTPAFA